MQKENRELKDKLDVAYKMQHQLENQLEEFQVEAKRKEDEYKVVKKKFYEFQKVHVNCEQTKKELGDKYTKLEKERAKINDKYIKLSQRLKDHQLTTTHTNDSKQSQYQLMYQKALEELHQLRVKLQGYEEKGATVTECVEAQKIF